MGFQRFEGEFPARAEQGIVEGLEGQQAPVAFVADGERPQQAHPDRAAGAERGAGHSAIRLRSLARSRPLVTMDGTNTLPMSECC